MKEKAQQHKNTPAIKLLSEMVAIPSVSKNEEKVSKHLGNYISSHGLEVNYLKNNVLVRIGSNKPDAKALLFTSHIDTVPPTDKWTKKPHEPLIENDRMFGLGSNDAGASIVTMTHALIEASKDQGLIDKLNKNNQAIIFLAAAEEEIAGKDGIRGTIGTLPSIQAVIIGEPSSLKIGISQRGRAVIDLTTNGQSAHSSRPYEGDNAAWKLVDELKHINTWYKELFPNDPEAPTLEVTIIKAGDATNQLPGSATATLDSRTTTKHTGDFVMDKLEGNKLFPDTVIKRRSEDSAEAKSTPKDSPLVKLMETILSENSINPETYNWRGISDWDTIPAQGVIFAPGDSNQSHQADESVDLKQIPIAEKIYLGLMKQAPVLLEELSKSVQTPIPTSPSEEPLKPDADSKKGVKTLWQKGEMKLDPFVENFGTKGGMISDNKLIPYDLQGSLAHAKMLCQIGILTNDELGKIDKGLGEIKELYGKGEFQLQSGDEDIHTKIENFLTEKYGDVGKKIHTGRSRNDQVLTAIRLYTKAEMEKIQNETLGFIDVFKEFNEKYGSIPMPGYTHMQKAMPSSIGLWTESFISSLEGDIKMMNAAYELIDQSPLGSAAGYGVPLNLDKKLTADLMNFNRVQENPIYVQQSRGKFEAAVLDSLIQVLLTVNKFASDVMLFTTQEFGFLQASDNITTGSSIMPQKKNVDIAEILRSKVHLVLGNYTKLVSSSSNLISGYNKDLAASKRPLMESLEIASDSINAATILVQNLIPNEKNLDKAMTPEIYATHQALELVAKGTPWREAYKTVGKSLQNTS